MAAANRTRNGATAPRVRRIGPVPPLSSGAENSPTATLSTAVTRIANATSAGRAVSEAIPSRPGAMRWPRRRGPISSNRAASPTAASPSKMVTATSAPRPMATAFHGHRAEPKIRAPRKIRSPSDGGGVTPTTSGIQPMVHSHASAPGTQITIRSPTTAPASTAIAAQRRICDASLRTPSRGRARGR